MQTPIHTLSPPAPQRASTSPYQELLQGKEGREGEGFQDILSSASLYVRWWVAGGDDIAGGDDTSSGDELIQEET